MKYNKALQNKLNITLNDYTIDCKFTKRLEERDYVDNLIHIKNNDNCYLSLFNLILQISAIICLFISLGYWEKDFFNIFLTYDIVYRTFIIFFLMTKKIAT